MENEEIITSPSWDLELECKPDFTQAMQRIYAWFEQQILDRPPVRFSRHNAWAEANDTYWDAKWQTLRDKWFDAEYQVEGFLTQIRGKKFLGETFPIFWPNLGPLVVPAFYGCPLEFGEVTSWASPILTDYRQPVALDWNNAYLIQLEKMTRCALERCPGRFMVGYSDLHSGIDWLAALRGTENLCLDLIENNAAIPGYLRQVDGDFLQLYDYFDDLLKAHRQLSATWMGIPSFGKLHIPSCDFSALISPRLFREFIRPSLLAEVQHMTHNIFHVDGKGVARHLEAILELPNVQAIQWVQGPGDDTPILQWVPLIRQIQAAGKSVVVELTRDELEAFIQSVRPEGILLCLPSEDEEEERSVLRRLEKWNR